MTNSQVLGLRAGDYIDEVFNGRRINKEILAVRSTGRCINPHSGAYGHAYACVTVRYCGSDLTVDHSLHSDEYSEGEGYPTYDANGERLRGWDLVGHNLMD